MSSYRVQLGERIQRKFGESLDSGVDSKTGPDHEPTITVYIKTPDGQKYKLTGKPGENKKVVLERLAEELIKKGGY